MKNPVVVLHNHKIIELTGGNVFCEPPAVGSDDDGRFACEPIQVRIRRDEGGKNGPLFIGEVGSEGGVRWREE